MSANTTQRSSPSGPDACEKLQFVQPPFTVGTAHVSLFTVALTPVRTTDVVRSINADLPADVLGGNVSDEVVELAKARIAKQSAAGEPSDALREIVKAQKAVEEAEKKRRRQVLARASYKTQSISPFDALDMTPLREPGWHKGRKPTEKQMAWLKKSGLQFNAETLTYWEATQLCGKLA